MIRERRTRRVVECVALSVVLLLAGAPGARNVAVADDDVRAVDIAAVGHDLLRRAGVERGVCVALGFSTDVVLSLVESSEILLHVRDPRREFVADLRRRAADRGLGIRRLVVEDESTPPLPHVDGLVDAVFVKAGDVVTSSTELLDEVLRVLRPGGTAVIMQRQEGSDPRPLFGWATRRGVLEIKLATVGEELWFEFRRPPLEGVDSWSHWEHGPDNNPVSTDKIIKAPYMTQYLAEPFYIGMPSITTAAGGRVFLAIGHIAHHEREWLTLNRLIARNGYNGTVLWERQLPEGYLVHRSAFVATAKAFYMIGGSGCLVLDPATGAERRPIAIEGVKGEWKWMAMRGDVLYALIGEKSAGTAITRGDRAFGGWSWGDLSKGYYGNRIPFGFGHTIVAHDLSAGRTLWTHREDARIDSRGMCLDAKKVYLYCPDNHLRALSVETGRTAWTNADGDLLGLIEMPGKGLTSTPGFRTACLNVLTPDALIIQGQTRMNVIAVSTSDGYLLWKKKKVTNNPNAIYIDGKVILGIGEGGTHVVVDPISGNVEEDLKFRKTGCTRLTASTDSLFCRGEGTLRFDRKSKRLLVDGAARPACNDGAIPANGLLYVGPWQCDCNLSLIGHMAKRSAGDFRFDRVATTATNLRREERHDEVAEFDMRDADWSTYRGNNRRTGGTSARVATDVDLRWSYTPERRYTPGVPTSAGGLVFVCGDDGVVRAIDVSNGLLKWSFATSAAVKASPTIAAGRVYVGSGDGRVHVLEAATGRLLWRFRAAPVERLIMIYGTLGSTWPVHTGILVEDGTAYLAAGIIDHDGTYVYALDARSGEIRWQNNSSGHLDPVLRKGISSQGTMALQGDRLLLAGGNQISPAHFDRATGECLDSWSGDGRPRANAGRFVGALDEETAIAGGRILYSAPENVATKGKFLALAEKGTYTMNFGGVPPAWDDDKFAMVNFKHGKIICCDTTKVVEAIAGGEKFLDGKGRWKANIAAVLVSNGSIRWASNLGKSDRFEAVSLVVCKNAVVAVVTYQERFRAQSQWYVVAFDASDGKPLLRREIRQAPFPGGLLVDRDGKIIVTTLDGGVLCLGP